MQKGKKKDKLMFYVIFKFSVFVKIQPTNNIKDMN